MYSDGSFSSGINANVSFTVINEEQNISLVFGSDSVFKRHVVLRNSCPIFCPVSQTSDTHLLSLGVMSDFGTLMVDRWLAALRW